MEEFDSGVINVGRRRTPWTAYKCTSCGDVQSDEPMDDDSWRE